MKEKDQGSAIGNWQLAVDFSHLSPVLVTTCQSQVSHRWRARARHIIIEGGGGGGVSVVIDGVVDC